VVFSTSLLVFITHLRSLLQLDLEKETAALLHVLIHTLDNSAYGDDAPVAPQQSGTPHAFVQVRDTLWASFLALIFSAFFALHNKKQLL